MQYDMGFPFCSPTPAAADGIRTGTGFVGNGAFAIAKWVPNKKAKRHKNGRRTQLGNGKGVSLVSLTAETGGN